jgi:hypothetical protein
MNRILSGVVVACLVVAVVAGCRAGAPIYDIKETAIPNSIDHSLSLTDVTKSITTAAAKHGWEMRAYLSPDFLRTIVLLHHG